MYIAIEMFLDKRDNGHRYLPGETYPREGYVPDEARIEELSGNKNARGYPLIAEAPKAEKPRKPTRKRVQKDD